MNDLVKNIDKLHTTKMGLDRISRNLHITTTDIVAYCYQTILSEKASMYRKGKNWYVTNEECIITVNAHSYTIITAHKKSQ